MCLLNCNLPVTQILPQEGLPVSNVHVWCTETLFDLLITFRLIPTTITGFSELKKRQKLQEQETLQHQKRLAVSYCILLTYETWNGWRHHAFICCHTLKNFFFDRKAYPTAANVHGKMSKVYYSNHSLGLTFMLGVWTIYALFTCLTIRLCNVHESHHTKHRRENYMPKNEDYKNRLGSVRIEPQACVLYLWQERSSYRNVEAYATIPNSTLADGKLPIPKNNTFLYCHIRFYTFNSKSTFLETALSHSPFVY